MTPLVDSNSISAYLDQQQLTQLAFEPIAAGMAQSGDLGYSYGKYSLQRQGTAPEIERGYYVRVWKRDGQGNWKIAIDVAKPLSKPRS
jgi:ketosteroid isomerase-like protein